ncbi:hypothetical protein OsJ_34296 [Oryza sativa Japonica Group]|uniref:EGF-like domain-containing protein n=1 Tax=Oryza sativa subsp. japonica TaxID=39947 RepID=B9GB92_ORYSJ|nr:hypothetical protein OsJ_34296 [Oryza sativa Japonica Group]
MDRDIFASAPRDMMAIPTSPVTVGVQILMNASLEENEDPAKYSELYPCYGGSKCHDTEGDYRCKCRLGRRGDGKIDNGCQPIIPPPVIGILGEP